MTQIRHSTCPLCEASCGLRVELSGDTITSIRGSADDPLSHGYICPKAVRDRARERHVAASWSL